MCKRYKTGIILLALLVLAGQILLRETMAFAYENLSLKNMTDTGEDRQEHRETDVTRDILNDWSYTEMEDSIILEQYVGQATDIVIPGNIDGKQVFLQNSGTGTGFGCFPEATTSIIVGTPEQKVKVTDGNAAYLFFGLTKLTYLDASGLDTSDVTSMCRMFSNCSSLTRIDVSGWDTGHVTDMSFLFQTCSSLSELDVSGWDTSNVINMYSLFRGCNSLTRIDVSGWDTGNVTDMACMFYSCNSLTELDLSGWNTSNIKGNNMDSMFYNCNSLTELNLNGWDTSNVLSMQNIFFNCSSLTRLDLSSWDTSSVISMNYLFYYCSSLTELNLNGWNTGSVGSILYMFNNCSKLQILDLSGHDYSNVMPGWTVGIFDLADDSAMLPTLIISSDPIIQSICDQPIAGRVPAGPTYHSGDGILTEEDESHGITMKYFDKLWVTDINGFTISSIANKYIPHKEGAVFSGWYLDKACTQPFETAGNLMSLADLLNSNLYAKYLNQYTVTFVDYDGNVLKESLVLEGDSAIAPEKNPEREGYLFIGWDGDFENITQDLIIKAMYEEKTDVQDNQEQTNKNPEQANGNPERENENPEQVNENPEQANENPEQINENSEIEKLVSIDTPKTADTSALKFCGLLLFFNAISFIILKVKKP